MIGGGKTVPQRGGEEEGDFWKSLQTHFLVYPAFEKRREPPLFLHPPSLLRNCVTTADPSGVPAPT